MTTCNLCGSDKTTPLYKGNVKCQSCGLIFIDPIPNNLQDFYDKDYYSLNTEPLQLEWLQIFLYKIKVWTIFNRFMRTIKIVPGGNLLDIGCGSGSFLRIVKKLGMNCYGVEPSKFDKSFAEANDFHIFNGVLEDAHYPDNFFDCITLNHVLEHTRDPMVTLSECKRILKEDGLIRIAVPQSASLAHWLFGENWVQLDAPRHLFTFSTHNLCEYAMKTGLHVKKIRYVSAPFSFGVKSKLMFALLYPLSFLCNRLHIGDTVEIVLRKRKTYKLGPLNIIEKQ